MFLVYALLTLGCVGNSAVFFHICCYPWWYRTFIFGMYPSGLRLICKFFFWLACCFLACGCTYPGPRRTRHLEICQIELACSRYTEFLPLGPCRALNLCLVLCRWLVHFLGLGSRAVWFLHKPHLSVWTFCDYCSMNLSSYRSFSGHIEGILASQRFVVGNLVFVLHCRLLAL